MENKIREVDNVGEIWENVEGEKRFRFLTLPEGKYVGLSDFWVIGKKKLSIHTNCGGPFSKSENPHRMVLSVFNLKPLPGTKGNPTKPGQLRGDVDRGSLWLILDDNTYVHIESGSVHNYGRNDFSYWSVICEDIRQLNFTKQEDKKMDNNKIAKELEALKKSGCNVEPVANILKELGYVPPVSKWKPGYYLVSNNKSEKIYNTFTKIAKVVGDTVYYDYFYLSKPDFSNLTCATGCSTASFETIERENWVFIHENFRQAVAKLLSNRRVHDVNL